MLNAVRLSYAPQVRRNTPIKGAAHKGNILAFGASPQEVLPPPISREKKEQYLQLANKAAGRGDIVQAENLFGAVYNRAEKHLSEFYRDKGYKILNEAVEGLTTALGAQEVAEKSNTEKEKIARKEYNVHDKAIRYFSTIKEKDGSLTLDDKSNIDSYIDNSEYERQYLADKLLPKD
jgi:hypothetical protein